MEHHEVGIDNDVLMPEQTMPVAKPRMGLLAWTIFITGVLYYCFAYLMRVYPSVMVPQLRGYFHITAGGFGLLTSFYYFAYAPMQLPVGVSVDRIGPRRSLIFACIMSALGVFVFAYFKNLMIIII